MEFSGLAGGLVLAAQWFVRVGRWRSAALAALVGIGIWGPALSAQAQDLEVLKPAEVAELRQEARAQLGDARKAVERNASRLGYSRSEVRQALQPAMVRKGTFVHELSDGTRIEFPWFRVGHARNGFATDGVGAGGLAETNKGGNRIHKGVFIEEVQALALKMDSKLALTGDALGGHSVRGAKGGIGIGKVVAVGSRFRGQVAVGDAIDPASKGIDRPALMRQFARSYRGSGGQVGVGSDIQAGDVNTKTPEMMALAREYARIDGKRTPSVGVSGKEVDFRRNGDVSPRGGIPYRQVSTGAGVWFSARHAARSSGVAVKGATVVSQGWGEVGRAFGMTAAADGAKVIAIEELWTVDGKKVAGTLVHPKGESATTAEVKSWLAEVNRLRDARADLKTFAGGKLAGQLRPKTSVATLKADIVGVNALGGTLNHETVPQLIASGTHQGRPKVIAEGANLAETSRGARAIDRARAKLVVIPGDLANLGGVHVSNLEAAQNVTGKVVDDSSARASLEKTIASAWDEAAALARTRKLSTRAAIELLATDRMMKRSLQRSDARRNDLIKAVSPRSRTRTTARTSARVRTKAPARRSTVARRLRQSAASSTSAAKRAKTTSKAARTRAKSGVRPRAARARR